MTSTSNQLRQREMLYVLKKLLCYTCVILLALMVEDVGEFKLALIGSVIVAEAVSHFLEPTRPWLRRPWVAPVCALLLAASFLMLFGILHLASELMRAEKSGHNESFSFIVSS